MLPTDVLGKVARKRRQTQIISHAFFTESATRQRKATINFFSVTSSPSTALGEQQLSHSTRGADCQVPRGSPFRRDRCVAECFLWSLPTDLFSPSAGFVICWRRCSLPSCRYCAECILCCIGVGPRRRMSPRFGTRPNRDHSAEIDFPVVISRVGIQASYGKVFGPKSRPGSWVKPN